MPPRPISGFSSSTGSPSPGTPFSRVRSARGLLLAAGAGRRMGTPKGLVRMPDGTPWVERGVRALLDGGCAGVTVVVGAEADAVIELVPDLPGVDTAYVLHWATGLAASLTAGLRSLSQATVPTPVSPPPRDPTVPVVHGSPSPADSVAPAATARAVTVAVVLLVDLPDIGADVIARVLSAGGPGPTALARAAYGGRPGHPVVIGCDHWPAVVAEATGDTGARNYLARGGTVLVECADLATGEDVDYAGRTTST